MKRMLGAAIILAALTVPSVAEMRYDRNLEKAAMAIVASKIGDIRGGFSYKQKPQLVVRRSETRRATKEASRPSADDMVQGSPPRTGQSPSIMTF